MNHSLTVTRLLTRKNALKQSRVETGQVDLPLNDGEALLKVARVAITTNNITYAAFGDAMQYWNFFPTEDPEWAHMPVWGFADVVASTVPGVEVGERFYGYFPIASHIRMRPERVTQRGFYDGSEHRLSLTSAYNQYTLCSNDAAYSRAGENYQMIVRPLFITSQSHLPTTATPGRRRTRNFSARPTCRVRNPSSISLRCKFASATPTGARSIQSTLQRGAAALHPAGQRSRQSLDAGGRKPRLRCGTASDRRPA